MSKGKLVTEVNFILENGIKILKGLPLIEISKLKLHPNNVKKHPEDQIKNLMELMKIVGFKDPVVIDKKHEVKAGHGRLEAAERLGMTKVPYVPLEGLTKKQMDLFMYMDNKVNESPWIEDNVQLLLDEVPLSDLDTFDVNWDNTIEINPKDETEEIPEPPVTPKTKLGDIYQLGNHRVMCGRSNNQENKNKLFEKVTPDIILTDPPYSSGGWQEAGKKTGSVGTDAVHKKIDSDNLSTRGHHQLLISALGEINAQTIYIFTDWRMWIHTFDIAESLSFPVRSMIVWDKITPGMGFPYRAQHELILYGNKMPGKMNKHNIGNIIQIKRTGNIHHTTEKPLDLLTKLIQNSEGKTVYDPFIGSGSTLIAAEQTGRTCYGMEIDPAYVDVIVQRWENFTGKKAKKL